MVDYKYYDIIEKRHAQPCEKCGEALWNEDDIFEIKYRDVEKLETWKSRFPFPRYQTVLVCEDCHDKIKVDGWYFDED